ncbi:hypothetical protein JOF56_010294 [Kibdelosporangium banguiense]|uniref:PKD domain-containing protein n=1 Tax=Kibdelosporangium banguiense TaxID=1365924 RepID=A0ABS4TZS5_9PSEU|nr:PKD domain-containing protein [Kibdelosporangium banguiense]MBP2329909.1 hypothetical protein [Kibdelosporangium banguiense]
MGFGFLHQPSVRTGLVALSCAVVVGGAAVFGSDSGHPATDIRLLSGMAWLASDRVGQLSLLDGSSAELAAQIQVAPAGNTLQSVQSGSDAYVVDKTAGTIRRIDGATFTVTAPEAPLPGADFGLTAFAGPDTLYALDIRRGMYANADPRTGARRGEAQTLAAQLGDGTAALDSAGRLWLVDNASGDLTRIQGDSRSIERKVTQPGSSVLTLANDKPLIVNTAARQALLIDPEQGTAQAAFDLDLRAEDVIQVSGSPHNDRAYIVAERGVLTICDVAAGRCDQAIPLEPGNKLGAAVEAGSKLFVPDHTSGRVWIVDLITGNVSARPQVLTPPGPFQLLTRDGMVFFNDPGTQRAGVVHLDGSIQNIAKYDPADPGKGLNSTPTQQQASQSSQQSQTPQQSGQPSTSTQPTQPQTPGGPATPPAATLRIVPAKSTVLVGEDLTLQVRASAGTPDSPEWTFGDNQTGRGVTVSHRWQHAQVFHVTVDATVAGQRKTASIAITVTDKPKPRLTVTAKPGGTVTGAHGLINCPPTCAANFEPGTHVTLTAQPAANHRFEGWAGVCTGTDDCDVTMDKDKAVTADFYDFTTPVIITMKVTGNGTATMNGRTCPPTCTMQVDPGQNFDIRATPKPGSRFVRWAPAETCGDDTVPSCTTRAEKSKTITATFQAFSPTPTPTPTPTFRAPG